MADTPDLSDILDAAFTAAPWAQSDKINADANGVPIGGLPESVTNKITAEQLNGILSALRKSSDLFRGVQSLTGLSVASAGSLSVELVKNITNETYLYFRVIAGTDTVDDKRIVSSLGGPLLVQSCVSTGPSVWTTAFTVDNDALPGVRSGDTAGRPAAATAGRLYHNTDTGLEVDAGSAWAPAQIFASHYASVASDGALEITTANRVIYLEESTTGTKAATLTSAVAGQLLDVTLIAASGGSYTIAVSAGTLTLDAAGKGARLVHTGAAWRVLELLGGATVV